MPFGVTYNITPVAQTQTMSCWAAAAAMLLTWKKGVAYTESSAAQAAGDYYVNAFNSNAGLLGLEVANFAQSLSLKAEAPQNFTPDGYNQLLTARGPLWVGTAIFGSNAVYRHVRILRGLIGDGSLDGTTALVVDPDGGRDYTETLTEFAKELEEIAKLDLGPGGDLNPQIIHFP